jgi:TonB family protein
MKCNEIRIELSAYIDGELEDSLAEKVKTHIESCRRCNEEYMRLLELKKVVRNMDRIEIDSAIPVRIFDRINEREPSSEIAWFPVTIRVALLLAIIFNIAIFNLFRDYRTRTPLVPSEKIIKVENIVFEEEQEKITVSFSFPNTDSIRDYSPPELLDFESPSYTSTLIDEDTKGTVILNVLVDKTGSVGKVKILAALTPQADSLAIASAKSMRFKPAYSGSLTIRTEVTATFNFRL